MTTPALLDRLRTLSTTSLVDAAPTLRILPLRLRPVAPGGHFAGRIVTARANRDLMSVIHALRESGPGDVLVVDAGGEDRAVAGELFATEAHRRGLAALVILGRSRDTGDDDGLVVGSESEFAAAIDGATAIEAREKGLQAQLLDGTSLFDLMNYEEHLAALREGRPGGLAFG